jgi:predicted nucleotidyltransferase
MVTTRNPKSLTSYPDANEMIDLLLTNVPKILQGQFVGMYIYGSIASGDFDEHSDIDILVVTETELSSDEFDTLKAMHEKIQERESPWAIQVEIVYVPRNAIRRFDPQNNQHPHLDRGPGEKLHIVQHNSDWVVQRYLIRERGIVLAGPDPKTLIDLVSADDLRNAMIPLLFDWYGHFPERPHPFGSRGYQSYVVLSLCRILYTIQTGDVVSKMAAARWAKEALDTRWVPLIDSAIYGRQHSNEEPLPEDVAETLNMIQYAMRRAKPTSYPDVNELLNLLLENVKDILGDQFIGMYLYGSLASGDFNPNTSDIDFLVVTRDSLPDDMIAQLETMHKQTWATSLKRAGELEGSYVPRDLIRRHDPNGAPCPTVNEGKFYMDRRGSDWIIQRQVVREYGVIVEGPDPKALIDFVSPDDIRGAVIGVLHEWWFPMLDDPSWLRHHEGPYRAFAVITMCRVLHALEHGTVVSKPKAIQWARSHLEVPWRQLIDQAVLVANHESQDVPLQEALDFIWFTKSTLKSDVLRSEH